MEIRLTDEQALSALVDFAKAHRAAIANWAAEQFAAATSPADKASFALEVLENYMAEIEELEMLYFALRAKVTNPGKSLFAHYYSISVSEEGSDGKTSSLSAAEILRQLPGLDPEAFAAALVLPALDDYVALLRGKVAHSEEDIRAKYVEHLASLKKVIQQAVTNRSAHALMKLYNKMKHGFAILLDPTNNIPFSAQTVTSETDAVSKIAGTYIGLDEARLREIAASCQTLAKAMREIMLLYCRKVPGVTA